MATAQKMKPVVVDIFRGDKIEDFGAMRASGIFGVVHKASEGRTYRDDAYAHRRVLAEAHGLRFGAYHFCDNSDPTAQVGNFLEAAGSIDGLMLAADFEDNPKGKSRNMRVPQLRQFLTALMEKTGRSPRGIWLYGGNRLKEEIVSPDDVAFFGRFPLWLCQYGPRAMLPKAWSRYGLWQYAADGHGLEPHSIAGSSTYGIDLNVFGGVDLASEWAPLGALPEQAPPAVAEVITAPAPVIVEALPDKPPVALAVRAEAHAEAHADLKDNSIWYNARRWFLKTLGLGSAGGSVGLISAAQSDPLTTAESLLGFAKAHGVALVASILVAVILLEVVQYWAREKALKNGSAA